MVRITLDKPYIPIPVPVTAIKYGLLYNWYAATDARKITSSDTWVVPSFSFDEGVFDFNTLIDYLGSFNVATFGILKETGTTYWVLPNSNATNAVEFNLRGNGLRNAVSGEFSAITTWGYLWFLDSGFGIPADPDNGSSNYDIYQGGLGIRLMRNATESEQLLDDGLISSTYTGNDGKVYRCTKIGTQVWLADNLAETKYRNGDTIPEVTDNSAWAALTTGALCAYNNDWSNVLI